MDQRTIAASDAHAPYHDPFAFNLFLKVVTIFQPNTIVLNGDWGDYYQLSAYDKDPERLRNGRLQDELNLIRDLFRQVIAAKPANCRVVFIPGNHEDRLRRFLWRNPTLHGLTALELPNLLGLAELGIEYEPKEVLLANDGLVIRHGSKVRPAGGASARAELESEKFSVSTITGHTHRIGSTLVTHRGGTVGAWEGGCLCSLKVAEDYVAGKPDWQLGITTIYSDSASDAFSVVPLAFLGEGSGMKAVLEGRLIRL
jgi:predicted phosphodiesterase